ncbi:cytochrome P450 [Actinomadura sp. CNU-125]|uniref:cytochrome P450 n=1 Tax=Actinomadura sp. CNU-125 TaxID=1904961 RepID=UPI000B1D7045|nr:cytochrome P450 [Actinomadura sp. CNU-125]
MQHHSTTSGVRRDGADPTSVGSRRRAHDFDSQPSEGFDSAHRVFRDVRAVNPVARCQDFGGFWAMLGHRELLEVITDIDRFTTTRQNAIPKFAFTGVRPPLHLDPPEHTGYRRVINRFFTPPRMRLLEPAVRRCVVELLEPLIARGSADVAREYAQRLPAHVFAEFFNLSVRTASRSRRSAASTSTRSRSSTTRR